MSRIGKKIIEIPKGVTFNVDGQMVSVKGSKGELKFEVSREVSLEITENQLEVKKVGKTKEAPAIWGTTRAIIQNMVEGVTSGFKKQLELFGVGYKMAIQGKKIVMSLGFSHPVEVLIPDDLKVSIEKNILTVEGIDKQRVGQFTAEIRALKKVEPYKGKGLKYVGEEPLRKEVKKTTSGS